MKFYIYLIFLSIAYSQFESPDNKISNSNQELINNSDKSIDVEKVNNSIDKNVELNNQIKSVEDIKDGIINTEIIEIDGVRYIKDGLRFIPLIESGINSIEEESEDELLSMEVIEPNIVDNLSFYGYDIFKGDPNSFQSSTFGAIDPDYNIGPGDEIIVMLWGESEFRQEFIVDREGYVFVPEVGQVFVNGLNLKNLEIKFLQILSKVYSTLKPVNGKPTTFMDISIGNLRPLRIIVLGEVNQPGAYTVSPSTTLLTSLYFFRGPNNDGSLREIRLFRKGNQIGNIDFYNYLLFGSTPNDLRLQLDDVVFVPTRGKTVSIYGEINRNGIYELKDDEGLSDLISIAGNLKVTAYVKRAQIKRIVPLEKRLELGMDRILVDVNLRNIIDKDSFIELYDGDVIEVFSIKENQQNFVEIIGSSVTRPGKYQLIENMRVSNLINLSDGLTSDSYELSAHIIRINDNLVPELINIKLDEALNGDLKEDIYLRARDKIFIYNNNQIKNNYNSISISGPVKKPGIYDWMGQSLGDLLLEARGFNNNISKVKINVIRKDLNSFIPKSYFVPYNGIDYIDINSLDDPESEVNKFNLLPDDQIIVYANPKGRNTQYVEITGAIYHPGIYPIIKKNERISSIISRAGGLLDEAYPLASQLIRNDKLIRVSFDNILSKENTIDDFVVINGDKISISTKTNYVEIIGEVNNPGIFSYHAGYNLSNYLELAGGLTTDAEKKEIWIEYPDGTSKRKKKLVLSPKVYDGSTIIVNAKEESEPVDKTELAKELSSIISDFIQIYLTLALLASSN